MRVVEVFEDDLQGGKADVTVTFGLDGTAYEIDLSDDNAQRLREALQPFVAAARPVAPARRQRRPQGRNSGDSPALVREWAKANGYDISGRGRIPAAVVAAYRAAHSG